MISENEEFECLKSIYKPTNLDNFYNQKTPGVFPPLLICDDKLTLQNKDILNHIVDNNKVVVGNDDEGNEIYELFNVRNQLNSGAELQERYSHNIDIDSELKRINYYGDQCFYDNYKINPNKVNYQQSPLALYKDILVKDYNKNPMGYTQHTGSYKKPLKCIHLFNKAPECSNEGDIIGSPVKHNFNNNNYCKDWNCQKFINNFTNRKMLSNQSNMLNRKPIQSELKTSYNVEKNIKNVNTNNLV